MHKFTLTWETQTLEFIQPAKTSRGAYTEKNVFLIHLHAENKTGTGEASPLPDLSVDGTADLSAKLEEIQLQLLEGMALVNIIDGLQNFPSLQFALESAFLQWRSSEGILFDTQFTRGETGIRINGLVWMNDLDTMAQEAAAKIAQGYRCIKFKIGLHDHDAECRFLENLRKKHNAFQLEIRLDANGAYAPEDALAILKDLSRFEIHSMEQPIQAGQWDRMAELCAKSPLDLALDEELIGIDRKTTAIKILKTIKPRYLILKPTLLGGFTACNDWIKTAYLEDIGWWATSALESNIGLGHIAQWVSSKKNPLPQGLGTGALYKNNFPPTTALQGEQMWFVRRAPSAM